MCMLVYMNIYTYMTTSGSQKWALDPQGKSYREVVSLWMWMQQVNSGSLQEQHVLLTVELVFTA